MKRATVSATISALLLLTGCVSSRPVHYYTLRPASPPSIESRPDGLVLLVGNITTPEALQDGRIRYRTGTNEAGAYEFHRWTERPGSMVREALLHTLRESGKFRRVLESGSAVNGDYLLRGKLDEFEEVDAATITTRISLHVELIDRKTNQNVWDRLLEREEPVTSKSVVEVVQSLDRNLQRVVTQAAEETDKFLSSRR